MEIPAQVKLTAGISGQEKVDGLSKSFEGMGRQARVSANMTAQAFAQLPVQLQDLAVQIAGGQNPLLALFQQGTQVSGAFGGIGNAMRAIGSVLTPARVAFGALGLAVGATTAAFIAGQMEASALSKALALSGNQAGITAGQFEQMVQRVRASSGATMGASRDLLSLAAGTGAFGPGTLESAASVMGRIQRLSGQTADDLVKDFARMRNGVAQWAAEHNRQYAYLTESVFKQIRALEQQGRTEEAIRLNISELDKALAGRQVQLGLLEQAWKTVKEEASSAWDAMKGIGRPETPEEELAGIEKQLQGILANRMAGGASFSFFTSEDKLRARADDLRRQVAADAIRATDRAAILAAERKAIDDIQSGFNDRMAETRLSGILQAAKMASEASIKGLELERAQIEQLQAAGLLTEQAVAERRLNIRQREIAEQQRLVLREIEIEKQRPVSGDPRLFAEQRSNRLGALRGRLSDLGAQAGIEAVLGSAEATKARVAQEKAYAKEYADAWKTANDFLLRLRQQNERGAAALLADPMERARAEVEIAVRDIKERAAEATKALEFEITEPGMNPEHVERVKQQIAEIQQAAATAVDIERAKMPGSKTWLQGLEQGFYAWRDSALDVAGQVKDAFTSAAEGMSDAMTQWLTTGKLSFRDFARSMLIDITRMITRMLLLRAIQAGINAYGNAYGSSTFVGPPTSLAGPVPSAKGNAFSNGIVSVPTLFGFGGGRRGLMGEAGPEAVMPLRRTASGDLGVQVAGGSSPVNVQVNVNIEGGETSVESENARAAQLGRSIGAVVRQTIIQEQRPGGLLAAA